MGQWGSPGIFAAAYIHKYLLLVVSTLNCTYKWPGTLTHLTTGRPIYPYRFFLVYRCIVFYVTYLGMYLWNIVPTYEEVTAYYVADSVSLPT